MSKEYITSLQNIYDLNEHKIEQLHAYVQMLLKWNKQINLIGKATEGDIWERHILDSAQLVNFIQEKHEVITDFGSGAGLPAIILSILLQDEPQIKLHTIEAVSKKATFLQEVSRILGLNFTTHNERIESTPAWHSDVITARAFAPIEQLFNYAENFTNQIKEKDSLFILLKGCSVQNEIIVAQKNWIFDYDLMPSIVRHENSGFVVTIKNVRRKHA